MKRSLVPVNKKPIPHPPLKIWVTKNNQVWASEMTGLSLEEIKQRYEEARKEKIICTIEVED